jgi:hypothetical protein
MGGTVTRRCVPRARGCVSVHPYIFKLYATYRLKDSMSLQGTYWHERYSSQNWMLDGVTPSTISNVLALGEQPPSYSVNVIMLSAGYNF